MKVKKKMHESPRLVSRDAKVAHRIDKNFECEVAFDA